MARQRSRTSHGRAQKRSTGWSGPFEFTQSITGAGKILLQTGTPTLPEQTLARTRGSIYLGYLPAAAANLVDCAFGIMIVSDVAAAAGAASIPGPHTDAGDDAWMVHRFVQLKATGVADPDSISTEFEIDSKAMRRLQNDQRVVFMWETRTITAGTLQLAGALRQLSILH